MTYQNRTSKIISDFTTGHEYGNVGAKLIGHDFYRFWRQPTFI